jgi:hypothetical protein
MGAVKAFLKFIGPIFAVFALSWIFFGTWEARIRMSGGALELSGVLMVVVGILETRFGLSLAGAARSLLSRFPWRRTPSTIIATAHMREAPDIFTAQGMVKPAVYHSMEERVALLEDALNQVRVEAGEGIRKEARERAEALEAEQRARESSDQNILDGIRKEVFEKHPREAMGTGWIALGIILATASKEIESLLPDLLMAPSP